MGQFTLRELQLQGMSSCNVALIQILFYLYIKLLRQNPDEEQQAPIR